MSNAGSIQAVTFDVGGTLIEPFPSVGHVYAAVAARHGFKGLPPETLNTRFRTAWKAARAFNYTRAGWEALVEHTFDGLLPPPGRVTFFAELYREFAEPEVWRVFEDVFPTLESLRARGVRLGVISNWDERLPDLLRRLGLDGYFASLAISYAVGAAKPARGIFEEAAKELKVPPAAILHVGDSAEMDERGARAAGFQAVLLRREPVEIGAGEIRSLTELAEGTRFAIRPN